MPCASFCGLPGGRGWGGAGVCVCEQNRVYLEAACWVFHKGKLRLVSVVKRTRHLPNSDAEFGFGVKVDGMV